MAQTAQLRSFDVIENEPQRVFAVQRAAYLRDPYPSYEERRQNLDKLERILVQNVDAIAEAINTDFGCRYAEESKLLEIFTSVDGIRHTRKKLRKWMKPQRRHVSILFATGSNRVIPQPKGLVGIVSPWNYPLFLTVSPLTSALAAGNRCMIKMATNSSTLCRLLAEKFKAEFPEETVAILPGVRAQDFSTLPFDHIIFTGSADAGRTVMRSAAESLTPVTLELGGKSPTIICDDFDVDTAADRIMYGKFVNAGQTCLAPDYVFVPEAKRDAFVAAARRIVTERYPDPNDRSYTSVIDEKSYCRLRGTLEDAEKKGARIGGGHNTSSLHFAVRPPDRLQGARNSQGSRIRFCLPPGHPFVRNHFNNPSPHPSPKRRGEQDQAFPFGSPSPLRGGGGGRGCYCVRTSCSEN